MGRTIKVCISVLIMIVLAALVVFLVSFFTKEEKDTYEGILVRQSISGIQQNISTEDIAFYELGSKEV